MLKWPNVFKQYRIEVVYTAISFIGSAVLHILFQTTGKITWLFVLSLFCTKMITGIYNYEYYRISNTPSMKVMLKHLLIKLV